MQLLIVKHAKVLYLFFLIKKEKKNIRLQFFFLFKTRLSEHNIQMNSGGSLFHTLHARRPEHDVQLCRDEFHSGSKR